MKCETYSKTSKIIAALVEGESDDISKMATIACELFHAFDGFDWVGFYRNVGDGTLKVGPYQGARGCLVIPFSKGVCGACASTAKTQIVGDVNAVANHIACSSTTRSEIVVPVWSEGELIAVLDVDSDKLANFDKTDQRQLEAILAKAFN